MDYLATLAPSSLEERIVQALASSPATRSELCTRLDVSRTVLGRALTELRQDGAVRVVAYRSHEEGRGRPVEQLGLAERIACAVGLHISRTAAGGIVLDRKGEVLASVLTPLSFTGWQEPLDQLCRDLKDRADDDGVDMSYVSRIGVGLPVPVGQGTGPGTALGEDLFSSVEQIVSPYWSGSLLVDNTIRMTALAEARWGAGQGAPEQIYVHLGGGVGACVIVADRIGGGSTGYAGELGHATVPGGTRPCQCGRTGCLETLASAPAVVEIAGAEDLAELRRMLDDGAPAARCALTEASRAVAQACATAALLMSPGRIVVGGELVVACPESVPQIATEIADRLVPGTGWSVEVVAAGLDALGPARGAAGAADSYVTACLEEAKRRQRSFG